MADTEFSTLIDTARNATNTTAFFIPEDWMQGRTAYGGLVAAMALSAMRSHLPADRKVRSLVISFIGPVYSDPFFIQTRLLRSGKSVTSIESRIVQNDTICSCVIGSFGADRNSKIEIKPIEQADMKPPSESIELPYIEGLTPSFTRHFAYRWSIGDMPFAGKGGQEIGGWINFREQTACLSEEWLIAMVDAWPTPVLSQLTTPAAASTLTWTLGFVHLNRSTCSENDWWSFRCRVDSSERGYTHETSTIWDPQGQLAIHSQQTTTVFA
jgi:acyl-CoA thioesterase